MFLYPIKYLMYFWVISDLFHFVCIPLFFIVLILYMILIEYIEYMLFKYLVISASLVKYMTYNIKQQKEYLQYTFVWFSGIQRKDRV